MKCFLDEGGMLRPKTEPPAPVTVVVADDHSIFRQGLATLIADTADIVLVGEAADGRTAIEEVLKKEPDVVLMDLGMPNMNGLEALRQIRKHLPDIGILVLSGYDNEEYVLQVVRAGASGYLVKSTDPAELLHAIRAVARGQNYFSASVSRAVMVSQDEPGQTPGSTTTRTESPLTTREREILQLVAEGKSHQLISEILHISVRTVDTHRNNIMKKLDIHDTASLVTYAIKNGILFLPK
jgi:DNA-binding NarL/FixJ family response regulator